MPSLLFHIATTRYTVYSNVAMKDIKPKNDQAKSKQTHDDEQKSNMAKTIMQTFRFMQKNGVDVGIIYTTGDEENGDGAMILSADDIADSIGDGEASVIGKLLDVCKPVFMKASQLKWGNPDNWMEIAADFFIMCWLDYQDYTDEKDKGVPRVSTYSSDNASDGSKKGEPSQEKPKLNDESPQIFVPDDLSHKA